MPTENDALIRRFYDAFGAHDGAAMAACYAPDARFSDPVFTDLRGDEPGAMWRMLTSGADESGLRIELAEHEAEGDRGSAHWIAHYTFSTGRPVVNDIRARFLFSDGLIAVHCDEFDFYKWTRQALGPVGLLLGWTPVIQGSVRRKARQRLDEFMAGDSPPS